MGKLLGGNLATLPLTTESGTIHGSRYTNEFNHLFSIIK